jgi:hypothetical protein
MAIFCKSGIICYIIKDMLAQHFSEKLRPSMPRLVLDMPEIMMWKRNTDVLIYHQFLQLFYF